ncbi:hypothetical protein SAMN06265348_102181 [Pedobacter westerhofensis]|uniref:Uncharacterized protein n=1 Tax=Pedobacter westerhofensis TaxID=425512 RepID=A0A521BC20_9SPHI|nr:hypothetical protein [Pedobacter westerhofensis]SMO44616.1 hypothetical protein SAMN06265348_102181 [Pedobacter westerhofensis]
MISGLGIGCHSDSDSNFRDKSDTLQIVVSCLENELVCRNLDSDTKDIFILKSRFINAVWPKVVGSIKVHYIEGTDASRHIIRSLKETSDRRIRLSVEKFDLRKDSVSVVLYFFSSVAEHHLELKKEDGKWKIVKSNMLIE